MTDEFVKQAGIVKNIEAAVIQIESNKEGQRVFALARWKPLSQNTGTMVDSQEKDMSEWRQIVSHIGTPPSETEVPHRTPSPER